jgi:hypothetical protein
MLALIYLGLAIALGDALCRRIYRFVSVPHQWAAAVLVGILLSTWFTYLAGLAFVHTAEPLLSADLLFFIVAAGAIFWLSKTAPNVSTIAPRAPGSLRWDWITLVALFAAACVLLIGTLYVNKQGRILISGTQISDLAPQLAIAQSFGLGHSSPTEFPHYASQQTHDQFLFYFQAGNLEFLGLNLAWSVDVLSVLGLTSMLAIVMALGELFFNSRVVGRLGAAFFFFHDSLRRFTNFFLSAYPHRDETSGFWKQIAFANQRHLPFAIGIFLLVVIFLVDRYRRRSSPAAVSSGVNVALRESKGPNNGKQLITDLASRIITSARPALVPAKSFVFSGLLLAALPLWNTSLFIAVAVVLCCLLVAYGCWRLSRLKTPPMLGRVLADALPACILAAGVIHLLTVYSSSRVEINYDREPLVKGLGIRSSVIYKILQNR